MTRARATSLVLVNWRGVFYERYLLDRRVTALEGPNGAGKTTVMIAAYLVLLPDLSRLRFTNVGETGASGGDRGIYGRLGREGGPSYAAIEFRTARNERLLAGVQIVRKGEPTVELRAFVATDLPDDVRLQDLFLRRSGEVEQVPELGELKDAVGRAAGRLTLYSSAKEYFAALFELGVTPLRLASDEDRGKLNEMLRTSMTGGISRTLTSDLRSFLLRPEEQLGETLATMRANLEACRRTRTEVEGSRGLQAEITGVYEAGEEMFAAAFHATRERAEEMRRAVDKARVARDSSAVDLASAEEALAATEGALATVGERLAVARLRSEGALDHAREVVRARDVARRLVALEREAAEAARVLAEREAERDGARDALARARQDARTAHDAWGRATAGLARLQEGLSELYRRAEAHRQATSRLGHASALLGDLLDALRVDGAHARVVVEQQGLDEEAAALDGRLRTAERRRTRHAEAVAALEAVAGPGEATHERAAQALGRLGELRFVAGRAPEVGQALARVRPLVVRQEAARARAAELGVDGSVGDALEDAERGRDDAGERRVAEERAAEEAEREHRAATARLRQLERRAAGWREATDLLRRLGRPLEGAEEALRAERDGLVAAVGLATARRDRSAREAGDLETSGGAFPAELLRVRDELGGELLATRFDDVEPALAGALEALLGPLTEAIVVDDARAAAARLAGRPRGLETVRLVDGEVPLDTGPADDRAGPDVVVPDTLGVRVSRVPERPTLGRRARLQRVAELRALAARAEEERLAGAGALAGVEERTAVVAELRARADVLRAGDPAEELARTAAEIGAAVSAADRHRAAAGEARRRATEHRRRAEALRGLLAEAHLLEPPDLGLEARRLEGELEAALRAKAEVERARDAAAALQRHLEDLLDPPPTAEDVDGLRVRLAAVEERRRVLFHAGEALAFVREHRAALAWTDAAVRLERERALVPELEAAEREARAGADRARGEEEGLERRWQEAVDGAQAASARAVTASALRDGARAELARLGVGAPTDADVAAATAAAAAARVAAEEVQAERDALAGRHAAHVKDRDAARVRADDASAGLRSAEAEALPHEERWARLRQLAEAQRTLGPAQALRYVAELTGQGSPNLAMRAGRAGERLAERLAQAERAQEVAAAVRAWISSDQDRSAEGYLEVWTRVLDWLRRRLPAHVAEVDDPIEALRRLSAELAALEERLRGQEAQLKGASTDVANAIEVRVRQAYGQVKRLNRHLEGVAFGSIAAIQVRSRQVESMGRILRALREEGQAQALLFEPGLPFEDALDELFRRYGGGGASGLRLLDYREYVELAVEVRRRTATEWEPASATRLSTGEAIGVGAAVMMVVLAEWERDANQLRAKKTQGSLRFLFLDEANRLDRGNLDEIFDLCGALDLQLLIAAPEVARAEGITTYHLERVVDGTDERVLATGRRARGTA